MQNAWGKSRPRGTGGQRGARLARRLHPTHIAGVNQRAPRTSTEILAFGGIKRNRSRNELLDLLAGHKIFGKAPREEHEWLVDHGTPATFVTGPGFFEKGTRIEHMFVLLVGRVSFFVDRGAGYRKVTEWHAGDLMGQLPYSRLTHSPGDTLIEEEAEVLAVSRSHFTEMTQKCPALTTACVHVMLDRARIFNASELQDEKMISLGRLSAGLAHELNNPASAAARSARLLGDAVVDLEVASRKLGSLRLTEAEHKAIDAIRDACLAGTGPVTLSPLERADREDEIGDWLTDHSADIECAQPLVETAVTIDALDALAAAVDTEALDVVLQWIAAGCTARTLSRDVEKSAGRIHDLVGAVKRFTHLDQPLVSEPLDLEPGLRDTVTMLGARIRDKGITFTMKVAPDTPRARVTPEINQVWTNLIDNALYAAPEGGEVGVAVAAEGTWIAVRVSDNGSGIPDDVAPRVFDPFYTTKPVGSGTGLGLDISRRILRQWGGEIDFTSEPGRTVFTVRLPAGNASPPAGSGKQTS